MDTFLHLSELVGIKPLDGLVAETNLFPPWRDIPKRKKKVAKFHNKDFMEKIAYFITIGKKGGGGT